MAEPHIVFNPYAVAERDIVEEIINRRNVRLTGHDDWYPVGFFIKTDEGGIPGRCRYQATPPCPKIGIVP